MALGPRLVGALVAVALILGVVGGVAVSRATSGSDRVDAAVVTGTVAALSADGRSLSFKPDRGKAAPGSSAKVQGYRVSDVQWRDEANVWNTGIPSCLSVERRIQVGIVHTRPAGDAPGVSLIAWIRCTP